MTCVPEAFAGLAHACPYSPHLKTRVHILPRDRGRCAAKFGATGFNKQHKPQLQNLGFPSLESHLSQCSAWDSQIQTNGCRAEICWAHGSPNEILLTSPEDLRVLFPAPDAGEASLASGVWVKMKLCVASCFLAILKLRTPENGSFVVWFRTDSTSE